MIQTNNIETDNIETDNIDDLDDVDENGFDNQWINSFKNTDLENIEFVNSITDSSNNISIIKIVNIYVNSGENILENITDNSINIYNNVLKRKDILELVNLNNIFNNKKYNLYFLLKFNVDISYTEIDKLLNYIDNNSESSNSTEQNSSSNSSYCNDVNNYLTVYNKVDDVYFNTNIDFLKKFDTLYFIYYEKRVKEIVSYNPALKIPYYDTKDKRSTRNNRKYRNVGNKGNKDNKDNKGIKNISNRSRKIVIKL